MKGDSYIYRNYAALMQKIYEVTTILIRMNKIAIKQLGQDLDKEKGPLRPIMSLYTR